MKRFIYILGITVGLLIFSSCQKTPEYVKMPYMCSCGSTGWNGTSYDVLGAEYVFNPDEMSRKYFITTEISADTDPEVRHINFELEIDDVLIADYDIADNPLEMSIKEVDYNSAIVYKEYQATSGTVSLVPAPFGGPEIVSHSLIVRQVIDGALFGPEIPFNGTYNLTIEL